VNKVKVEDAIGMSISHDMTKVVPGKFKGAAFKRGHIITEEDIPVLKSMGKEHIYVGEIPRGYLHEDESSVRIAAAICDTNNFMLSEVSEGKINIMAKHQGLLKIDKEKLFQLNSIEHIAISTVFDDIVVERGQKVASERIIPLFTKEENIKAVEEICKSGKVIEIKQFMYNKVHLIITGNEVYKGLIEDKFYDAIKPKMETYNCEIVKTVKVPDDKEVIKNEIKKSLEEGADIILCTGGMSVDEDDITPIAIKEQIDELIVHGIPVQPGNMFLLGYSGKVPIMGLPGAIIFYENTVFDVIFPKIICGDKVDKELFVRLSLGGLCYFCAKCNYPNCTFCKGR